MRTIVCYEHPLNEKTRTLLRFESLFQQFAQNARGQSEWESRVALQGLFDILSLTGRKELKAELIKELERYSTALSRLQKMPGVDNGTLIEVLHELDEATKQLRSLNNTSLEAVHCNDLLNAVRQRSHIPGGACYFDLPALYYWLQQSTSRRAQQLEGWIEPLRPMQEAISLILRLTRNSATPRDETALQGFFQKALDSSAPNQMVRVILNFEHDVFPVISGGKNRVSIRFMEQPDPNQRAKQTDRNIDFQLVCCVI